MNAILVFECAARNGSFSAAARALGTSQPSVSRHISNLEANLGCKLFSRHNNQIALTESGGVLFQSARDSIEALHSAIAECRSSVIPKVLTIGCTHGFSHLWIMPLFSSLQSVSKDWELRVVTSEYSKAFMPGEMDFTIRFCDGAVPPHSALLFEEEVVLVASPNLLSGYNPANVADNIEWLRELPLIHLDDGEEDWISWRDWFASHNVQYQPPAGTYFLRNYAFSLQAAAEGKGVALAWRHLLGTYQENGWLEVLDFASLRSTGSYRLVYSPEWSEHEIGEQIIKWFKVESASSDPPAS